MNMGKQGQTLNTPSGKERIVNKFGGQTQDSTLTAGGTSGPPQFIRSFDRDIQAQKRFIN